MFKKQNSRDSYFPDFRVGLIAIGETDARISISPKNPTYFSQNVISSNSSFSAWLDFYSEARSPGADILSITENQESLSRYTPATVPSDYDGKTAITPGGELTIPMNQALYFWVKIAASYTQEDDLVSRSQVGSPAFNSSFIDTDDLSKNTRIEWGDQVPDSSDTVNGEYYFNIPIFKLKITNMSFDIERYDCGECVYLSDNSLKVEDRLDFSRVSSYYD